MRIVRSNDMRLVGKRLYTLDSSSYRATSIQWIRFDIVNAAPKAAAKPGILESLVFWKKLSVFEIHLPPPYSFGDPKPTPIVSAILNLPPPIVSKIQNLPPPL